MRKKAAIVTLYGNNNYGNKLQNYALQKTLEKFNLEVYTIKNISVLNVKDKYLLRIIYYYLKKFIHSILLHDDLYTDNQYNNNIERTNNFNIFNEHIKKQKKYFNYINCKRYKYDYYFVGSDQVWNPFFGLKNLGFLDFVPENEKKIAFSASIGVNEIPDELKNKYSKSLKKFKLLSLREERGKSIVEELTGRKDVEVLVDPTMLLTPEEWDKVSNRPKQLDNIKEDKYILSYFLGELSDSRRKEIERVANENNCHIINILDKNDPFYTCGPSEFLYLEKHAFLICTDSFHSSVFAILYNRPFIIFDREQKGMENMNSRIDTLINKFKLKNRKYNGNNITKENLDHDYSEAYKILEKEREKSKDFLEKALDIK